MKSLIVGAYLIGKIARSYGLMTYRSLRSVTLGLETSLLSVAKLVDLGICRYNRLGLGEMVDDLPGDGGNVAAEAVEHGVNFMSNTPVYSSTPSSSPNLFGLFDDANAGPSTSQNQGNDMDKDETMSSPNHPTSNIEDAFSLNFPDYLPASPDYVSASPRKTYSSSSNSFGLVPIASPTLLLFYDDPYIKEFSSPKKQGHDQSSSSTSTLPQAFEIGESSCKTSLKEHEEQIKGILNHLDELSLDCIEHIEDKIEGLGQGRNASQKEFSICSMASEVLAMTQAAISQLVIDSVATALKTQAVTMANANNANRNPKPREALVARKCSYKEFMSCQPFNYKGSEGAIGLIL
nr:hypothetical protein [Tanacetum cinerariifolium]